MTDTERRVLRSLGDLPEGHYSPFAPICDEWGLDRKAVRRACRSLARRGLTEFRAGLWNEDGETAGAGYGLTPAGKEILAALSQ